MQVESGLEEDSVHLREYPPLLSIQEGLGDFPLEQQKDEKQILLLREL
jgi:hypothetical protein